MEWLKWNGSSGCGRELATAPIGSKFWYVACGGNAIKKWINSKWSNTYKTPAMRVAVGRDRLPVVVKPDGSIIKNWIFKWSKKGGCLRDISIGKSGPFWGVGCTKADDQGNYYVYTSSNLNGWSKVPGIVGVRAKATADGGAVVINAAGETFIRVPYSVGTQWLGKTNWKVIGTSMIDVSVNAAGVIAALGKDEYGYMYAGSGKWTKPTGNNKIRAIGVRPDNQVIWENQSGTIYLPNFWKELNRDATWSKSACGRDMSVSPKGSLFVVDCGGGVDRPVKQRHTRTNVWGSTNGGVMRIAVDNQEAIWAVNSSKNIYFRDAPNWIRIEGCANDIGVGANGSIWIIGCTKVTGGYNVALYDRDNKVWTDLEGAAGVRIAVDGRGRPYVVNESDELLVLLE